jgi:hypothetical protein
VIFRDTYSRFDWLLPDFGSDFAAKSLKRGKPRSCKCTPSVNKDRIDEKSIFGHTTPHHSHFQLLQMQPIEEESIIDKEISYDPSPSS